MINLKILESILADYRLKEEQSEELQKVIYMLDDTRLVERRESFMGADNVEILYLCDKKACGPNGCPNEHCTHTKRFAHALNYTSASQVNFKDNFTLKDFGMVRHMVLMEKEH